MVLRTMMIKKNKKKKRDKLHITPQIQMPHAVPDLVRLFDLFLIKNASACLTSFLIKNATPHVGHYTHSPFSSYLSTSHARFTPSSSAKPKHLRVAFCVVISDSVLRCCLLRGRLQLCSPLLHSLWPSPLILLLFGCDTRLNFFYLTWY